MVESTAKRKTSLDWWNKPFTRRTFLGALPFAGVGAAVAGEALLKSAENLVAERVVDPVLEQIDDIKRIGVSNEVFLKENEEILKDVELGCSFSPEQIEWLYQKEDGIYGDVKDKALEALKIIVKDLKIRNIRLGIRWYNAPQREDGSIDFSFYEPYFNYLLNECEEDVDITLNVGGKVFRYPEQHHSPVVLKRLGKSGNVPENGSVIEADSDLAKETLKYTDSLLKHMTAKYGEKLKSKVKVIQIENEPFVNFGQYKWTMSEEYLEQAVELAHKYFPESSLLFNTGPFRVKQVGDFMKRLLAKDKTLKGKLIFGLDYYYQVDDPDDQNNWINTIPVIGQLDPFTKMKIAGSPSCPNDIEDLIIQIAEGQMEGWRRYEDPGNSVQHLRYMILRCAKFLMVNRRDVKKKIYLWGIEGFVKKIMQNKLTKEHIKMRDFMLKMGVRRGF